MKLDMDGNMIQPITNYTTTERSMLCGKRSIILTPCDRQESNQRVISPSEAASEK